MKIKFCRAATGVTGSCHLLTSGSHKILLDCGQFQGGRVQDAMNRDPFPFDPAEIQCVVLSHAHIDHCGRIPLLVKRGFRGKVYCTDATADLLDVMLKDSGYIHEKEAEWQNRKNERAGRPLIEPLYTYNDAVDALKHIKPILYDELFNINEDIKIVFNDAGHILGSAITELWVAEGDQVSKIVYTGDLGVEDRPILRDPVKIKKADYVIMESTYGNRLHPKHTSGTEELLEIIMKTTDCGGTVVIPSFAVGRTQELIYELNRYYEEDNWYRKNLEKLMVYIDSPMAKNATDVFKKNAQVFDEEMREYILKGDHPLEFKNLVFTRTADDSRALNADRTPKVIISASGMCEAGRIRHHLKHNLWDPKSSIVFVGYQAEGTLGRSLLEGIKDVTLFGEQVHVNAEIHNLEGFSGHADKEGLLNWVCAFQRPPKEIFLVHGEQDAKEALAADIRKARGYTPVVVEEVSEYQLDDGELLSRKEAIEDMVGDDSAEEIRTRISRIRGDLEEVLYNSSLFMGEDAPAVKKSQIKNIVLGLEKQVMSLGTALTTEEND